MFHLISGEFTSRFKIKIQHTKIHNSIVTRILINGVFFCPHLHSQWYNSTVILTKSPKIGCFHHYNSTTNKAILTSDYPFFICIKNGNTSFPHLGLQPKFAPNAIIWKTNYFLLGHTCARNINGSLHELCPPIL